ncbi:MAG: DPP IV N-terminal domain-containing protein, partial [Cyanobacteria bacterium J06639_1]
LERPLQYGQTYSLNLAEARDRQGRSLAQPYELELPTRDRQFLAIGTGGRGAGQLIHVNLTTGEANLVTPPDLEVSELAVGGDGDTAYFFAGDRGSPRQNLYQLSLSDRESTLLLDSETYQNFRLKVSPDGSMAMVERIDNEQPSAPELWMRASPRDRFAPIDIGGETRGDFSIAPDNNSLIVAQGQGIAVVPLNDDSSTPDFLPQFGQILAIAPDGSAAAAVQFNSDISQTLAVVTHTGQRHDLARASGSIQSGIFAPSGTRIYAAIGIADPETFAERPQIVAYNWSDRAESTLVSLSYPATLEFDVAPDESAILYSARALDVRSADEAIASGTLDDPDAPETSTDDRIHLLELGDPTVEDSDRRLTLTSIAGRNVTWIP